jgi:beta-aspartyl-peptidase (threonine type)
MRLANPIGIAIHGGCGALRREEMSDARWAAARDDLARSLRAGYQLLKAGGPALDAVEAAVRVMEDSPAFNAGHGAAFNSAEFHELDASIMCGKTLKAGAVCGVQRVRNPISAARAVMDRSECVLLMGQGADDFAAEQGLALVDNGYFSTEWRRAALKRVKELAQSQQADRASEADKHGTVGAVALDAAGDLAAATSTGGFTNKRVGRIGDSAVIGAGTYARNGVCAVSCTGQGEVFIRLVAAHEIAARLAYRGETLEAATGRLIFEDMKAFSIGAGLCAIDAEGRSVLPFNTVGMYRGAVTVSGELLVGIHDDLAVVERL